MHKHNDFSTTSAVVSSFEVEDDINTANILNSMDFEKFSKLRGYIFGQNVGSTRNRTLISKDRDLIFSTSVSRTDFIVAMENILDCPCSGIGAAKVFDDIDVEHKGYITWENFLDHAILHMGTRETARNQPILSPKPIFHGINHGKRAGNIAKIISITTEAKLTYVIVTVWGYVSLYDADFETLLSTYYVPFRGFQETSSSSFGLIPSFAAALPLHSSKIAKSWITDAILMEDTNVIVFAASDRSLHFRDVGGRGSPWMFHVTGLRNIPTCLAYTPSQQPNSDKSSRNVEDKESKNSGTDNHKSENISGARGISVLLFGDDGGNIWSLKFLQPNESLFRRCRRKGEGAEHIHWLELENDMIAMQPLKEGNIQSKRKLKTKLANQIKENAHAKHVEINVSWNVHTNAVSQISFRIGAPHAIVSCSSSDRFSYARKISKCNKNDNGASLILQAESSQATPYIFKITSGISCFDLWEVRESANIHECFMLASGSCDTLIRLWNPYVPLMVVATLTGHANPIKDLMFLRQGIELLLISVCSNAEVRVWRTNGQGNNCCLQVVSLIFPSLSPLGKKKEFGSKVLYIHQSQHANLLVTCNSEVAVLSFEHDVKDDDDSMNIEPEIRKGKTNSEDKDNYILDAIDSIDDLNFKQMILCGSSDKSEISNTSSKGDLELDSARREQIFASAFAKFSKHSEQHKGLNECQSLQQRYQKEMKRFVCVCAPHLALPIYPPATVTSQPSVKHSTSFGKCNEKEAELL